MSPTATQEAPSTMTDPTPTIEDLAALAREVASAQAALDASPEKRALDEARARRNRAIYSAATAGDGMTPHPLSEIARAAGVSRSFAVRVVRGGGIPPTARGDR